MIEQFILTYWPHLLFIGGAIYGYGQLHQRNRQHSEDIKENARIAKESVDALRQAVEKEILTIKTQRVEDREADIRRRAEDRAYDERWRDEMRSALHELKEELRTTLKTILDRIVK